MHDGREREAQMSGCGWGAQQQREECVSVFRMGQPQGAATEEEEAEGIRMGDFF
jgi:hypothetical protein